MTKKSCGINRNDLLWKSTAYLSRPCVSLHAQSRSNSISEIGRKTTQSEGTASNGNTNLFSVSVFYFFILPCIHFSVDITSNISQSFKLSQENLVEINWRPLQWLIIDRFNSNDSIDSFCHVMDWTTLGICYISSTTSALIVLFVRTELTVQKKRANIQQQKMMSNAHKISHHYRYCRRNYLLECSGMGGILSSSNFHGQRNNWKARQSK